jgi:hypothetical protein
MPPIDDTDDLDVDTGLPVGEGADDQDDELDADDSNDDSDDQDDSQDDDNLGDDDAGDDDSGDDTHDEGDDQPAPKKQSRFQKLSNRARVAETELERLRAKEAARDAAGASAPAGLSKADLEAEEARIAAMEPTAREAYLARKESHSNKQALAYINFKLEDSTDASMYASKAVIDPLHAKYATRVEAKLAEMRKQGQNSKREVILSFLIGEDMLKRRDKGGAGPRKKAAASRVNAAQSKPARGRSDAGGYKPKGKSAEERLEGVLI